MRITLLAVLTVLLAPVTAHAHDPPTDRPLTGTRITVSLQIAADFWDAMPDCELRVYAATNAELEAFTGQASEAATRLGVTPGETVCPIWLADTLAPNSVENRIRAGTDLVHEVGHRLGYGHDTAPWSVMAASAWTPWPVFARFAPRGYGRVWRDLHPGEQWATRPPAPS